MVDEEQKWRLSEEGQLEMAIAEKSDTEDWMRPVARAQERICRENGFGPDMDLGLEFLRSGASRQGPIRDAAHWVKFNRVKECPLQEGDAAPNPNVAPLFDAAMVPLYQPDQRLLVIASSVS